jgi:hypothetical protein
VAVLTANQDQPTDAFLGTITEVYGNIIPSSSSHQNGSAPQSSALPSSGFTLAQELKHWAKQSDPGGYNEILEPLAEKHAQLDQMTLDESEEFVEIAEFVIDGLWNASTPYPQSRMKQLIEAICEFLLKINVGNGVFLEIDLIEGSRRISQNFRPLSFYQVYELSSKKVNKKSSVNAYD